MFAYVTHRIPEIADEPYRIDDALRAGFGWEMGAFETMDAVGVTKAVEQCKAHGQEVAQWVHDFLAAGHETFYTVTDGVRSCYNPGSKAYEVVPGQEGRIKLAYLGEDKVVWQERRRDHSRLGRRHHQRGLPHQDEHHRRGNPAGVEPRL